MTMRWTEQLSVGNAGLDEQHRQIIALLNELGDAIEAGQGAETAGRILTAVGEYAQRHFAAEERLFLASAYPDKEGHLQKHRDMLARVAEMQQEHAAGTRFLSLELLQFLQDWLCEHIMKTDKTYACYLPREEG